MHTAAYHGDDYTAKAYQGDNYSAKAYLNCWADMLLALWVHLQRVTFKHWHVNEAAGVRSSDTDLLVQWWSVPCTAGAAAFEPCSTRK